MIDALLYDLKRRFPTAITIVRRVEVANDYQSGVKTIRTDAWKINKAIKLPSKMSFVKLAGQGAFESDAFVTRTVVVVDLRDVPQNVVIIKSDNIQIATEQYSIYNIVEFYGSDRAIVLELQVAEGNNLNLIHVCKVFENLLVGDNNEF